MTNVIKSTTNETTKPKKVVLERSYEASVEELWELWTTKEAVEFWWGPEGFRVEVRALEPRAGGAFHYDMIAAAPEQIAAMKKMGQPISHETRGWYGEFDPHNRLSLVHLVDFVPGVKAYESTTWVELFQEGKRARMVITIDPMHDEQWTKMAVMGWTSQLTKVDKRFENRTA